MEKIQLEIQKMFELMGLNDCTVNCDIEERRISVFVNEGEWFKKMLPRLMNDVEHLARLLIKKYDGGTVFVDINNYRRERENLIVELAKASARKALISKEQIELPPMNAYERRIIHAELSTRPDVKTESVGEGRDRRVVVRPL